MNILPYLLVPQNTFLFTNIIITVYRILLLLLLLLYSFLNMFFFGPMFTRGWGKCLALLVALVTSSVPVGGGGRLSVGAVRRVTNWVLCLILSLSFLRSTGRPLVNGPSVVLPLPLFALGLLSRLLIFVNAIRLLLRASGRVALSPLLAFPMFSGIVRVGSILRSFLLVVSSPRSSLVLGGTVVRTRTWLLPFGLGCALSKIACGTPVSLGVLLTPFLSLSWSCLRVPSNVRF